MNAIDKRPGEKLLHDLLPYTHYEESTGLLWLKDGSATKTFAITPRNCMSCTDEDLEVLRSSLLSVLGHVPEGTLIQFWMCREKTNSRTDQAYLNWVKTHLEKEGAEDNHSKTLFETKLAEFKKLWQEQLLFQTKIYLSVRVSPFERVRKGGQLGAFSHIIFSRNQKTKYKSAIQIQAETQQVYDALKLGLEGIGFDTNEVEKTELLRVIFQFLNPDRNENQPTFDKSNQFLSECLALSELVESKRGLKLGRSEIKVGTLKTLPESSFPCLMNRLAALDKDFSLVLTLLVLPQTAERERLSRKQRLAQGMASGNNVRNLYAENQLQDIEDTLAAMISSGDKLLAASFHIITFDKEVE